MKPLQLLVAKSCNSLVTYIHKKDNIVIDSPLEQLFNRPVLIYLVVVITLLLLPIILLNLSIELEFFLSLILIPAFPIVYLENFWINRAKKNPDLYQSLYRKLETHRTSFLAAGVITSFFIIIITGIITPFLKGRVTRYDVTTGEFSYFTEPILFKIIIFLLVFSIFILISLIAFYRVYINTDGANKKQIYFNSSGLIQTLLLYFTVPVYLGVNVSLVAVRSQFISLPDPITQSFAIEQIFSNSGSLIIFIPFFIVVLSMVSIPVIPNFLHENQIQLSSSSEIRKWITSLGVIILISAIVLKFTLDLNSINPQNLQLFNYLEMLIIPIAGIYFTQKSLDNGKFCDNCSYFYQSKCPFCENNEVSNKFIAFLGNVKHPKCPNCGIKWDTLNRRCTNCEYTIVLSCENCSQTINPLWKKCNLCGAPRRTIPDLALNLQNYPQFARSRQILVYLAVIISGLLVFLTISILLTWISIIESETNLERTFGLFDDISFSIYFAFLIFWIVFILLKNRKMENRSILILSNKLIFTIIETLFVISLVFLVFTTFNLLIKLFGYSNFFFQEFFLYIFMIIVSILVLVFYIRSKLLWVINFQPTIKSTKMLPEVDGSAI